jgi:hypothetical protein
MISAYYFIIGAISAVVGYRVSLSTKRRLGVTPRRWSPILWAFICGASFLVGFILLAIAMRSTPSAAVVAPSPAPLDRGSSQPPIPNSDPSWSRVSTSTPEAGWYPERPESVALRYWDGTAWTEFTSPSNSELVSKARYDATSQRTLLLVWATGFGAFWIFMLCELLFGQSKPPLPFTLVWLCGVGVAVPLVVSRAVHRLEVESGQLSWRGLLRRGRIPFGDLRSISPSRNYVMIKSDERTLYLLDSAALRPFVDVLRRVAPGVAVHPSFFTQTKWWQRSQMRGRFVAGAGAEQQIDRDLRTEPASGSGWRSKSARTSFAAFGVLLLVSTATLTIVRLFAYLDDSPAMSAPGHATLHLDSGTYILFEHTARAGPYDCSPTSVCVTIGPTDVSVTSTTHQALLVQTDPSADGISRHGLHYAGAVVFHTSHPGTYVIGITTSEPGQIVVALGPSEEAFALSGWIILAAIGLVLIAVALIGTATSYRDRRGKSRRPVVS